MTVDYPGMPPDESLFPRYGAEFSKIPCENEKEIIEAASEANAVITILTVQPFPARVLAKLHHCRIIASAGIGYENIDVKAANDLGILVSNTPEYCLEEVSDHTMALILACARKLIQLDKAVNSGKWDSLERKHIRYHVWPGILRLRGQTLGLVGFGKISRRLVPKAKGFGLRILAYDPYVDPSTARRMGVESVELERIFRESDFLSVHVSSTTETLDLIGLEELKKMKPTAYLINTARGKVIEEKALIEALKEGYIAGAGLDVLDHEPPEKYHPFFDLDNVIITAHSAHYSETSMEELKKQPVEDVLRVFKGEWPSGLVNPDAKDRFMSKWGKTR